MKVLYRKKITKLLFMLSLFFVLTGCEKEPEVKETEINKDIVSITDCECPINFKDELYIDSVFLDEKFQIITLSYEIKENEEPLIFLKKTILNEDEKTWSEERKAIKSDVREKLNLAGNDNKEKKYGAITKICKKSENTMYALWQEYKLEENEDDTYNKAFIKFGILEIDTVSGDMDLICSEEFEEIDSGTGVTDFGITEDESFLLYFGNRQRFVIYNPLGEKEKSIDMSGRFSGMAQLENESIWGRNQNTKELVKYIYLNGEIKESSKTPLQGEDEMFWRIFGSEDEGYFLSDAKGLHRVIEGKEVKDLIINKQINLPESFTDIVASDISKTCYMLGPKNKGDKESENANVDKNKINLQLYLLKW